MDKTVQQYARDTMRICGQMQRPGRGVSPEQLEEVTFFLNQLLDSWNTMRNKIFQVAAAIYTLSPNLQYYLIGPSAARTVKISFAQLIYQTAPQELNLDLEIIDTNQQANIRVPGIFSIPLELYYDNGYSQAVPTGVASIFLYPGPQLGYQLRLYTWQALNSALSSSDTLFVPPGYARALTYNLALELPADYRKELSDREFEKIERTAQESRNSIESLNAPCEEAVVDVPTSQRTGRSRFNWLSPLG